MSVPSHRPYVWMLCGCVSFAFMSALAHEVSQYCNWQTVAFFRSFLVLVIVGAVCVVQKTPFVVWRPARLWHRSLAGSFSLVTAFFALAKLKASTVTTLTNTFPIWVALLSWPMLGLFPSWRAWLAVLGGVVGVILIQQPQAGDSDLAFGLALASAVSTSVAMLGLHRLKGVNPNAVVVHFSGVATLASAVAMLCFENRPDAVPFYTPKPLALLLAVGLFASIGQMFLTRAFAAGDPAKVSVVGLSQVVFTLLIDVAFVGHELTRWVLLGTFLILAPTAWVMLERKKPVVVSGPVTEEAEEAGEVVRPAT